MIFAHDRTSSTYNCMKYMLDYQYTFVELTKSLTAKLNLYIEDYTHTEKSVMHCFFLLSNTPHTRPA